MKASEVIARLQELIEVFGDEEVLVCDNPIVQIDFDFYEDGEPQRAFIIE